MTEDTIKRRARGLDRAFDILDFLKAVSYTHLTLPTKA